MRICYLDCFSGVAGDMLLGALIDAGLEVERLRGEIAKLALDGVELHAEPCLRKGVSGVNVTVKVARDHPHRSLRAIEKIIAESGLDETVKRDSARIFRRLGEVEAAIHGVDVEKIHFHEVGAIDAIVDIVGACVGFRLLGVARIHCSPLNLGGGTVKAAHGVMPVPAPATAALVKGIPVYSDGPAVELTTPTGAAIVATLAETFGAMPAMAIRSIGYGAGDREFADRANMLRIVVGEASAAEESTAIFVLEATIDDMTPEAAGYAQQRLLEEGALDVTLTAVQMKKGRPGFILSVLAKPEDRERLSAALFTETSTIGVRMHAAERRVLERSRRTVATKYGDVRVKVASLDGVVRNVAPEYEDCRELAGRHKVSFQEVCDQAKFEYLRRKEER